MLLAAVVPGVTAGIAVGVSEFRNGSGVARPWFT